MKGKAGPTPQASGAVQKAHAAHRKTMLNPMNWHFTHEHKTDVEAPSHLAALSAHSHPRLSIANPFGWHTNKPDTTTPLPTIVEPQRPERAMSRSDSIRTCDNDETTKKAVQSIWLKDKLRESARKGYEGREKRKENWEEDVGKSLGEIGGSGSNWWWEGKGKGKEKG